jgi:hypothetical protein
LPRAVLTSSAPGARRLAGHVQRDDVGGAQQRPQVGELHPVRRRERPDVGAEQARAPGPQPGGHRLPDVTEADDAHRGAAQRERHAVG